MPKVIRKRYSLSMIVFIRLLLCLFCFFGLGNPITLKGQNFIKYTEPDTTKFVNHRIVKNFDLKGKFKLGFYLYKGTGKGIYFCNSNFRDTSEKYFYPENGWIQILNTNCEIVKLEKCKIVNFTIADSKIQTVHISGDTITQFYLSSITSNVVNISTSVFRTEAIFSSVWAKDFLFIDSTLFYNDVLFHNVHIQKWAIPSNLTISNSSFHDNIVFDYGEYQDGISFTNNSMKALSLSNIILRGNIEFERSVIKSKIKISSVILDSANIYFINTILPDTIVIDDIRGNGEIYFNEANFTDTSHYNSRTGSYFKKHLLIMKADEISKIHIDYRYFKLGFQDSKTKGKILNYEKEVIYEKMLENFKRNGQPESYKLLDIEYQEFKIKFRLVRWVLKWWWNYGYNKELVFRNTLILLFIFWSINLCFLPYLVLNVYAVQNIPVYIVGKFWRRLWFSFIYTLLIFFSLNIKYDNLKFKERIGSMYILILHIVGLICLGYIANYVIQR